jgi:hypothetical protein
MALNGQRPKKPKKGVKIEIDYKQLGEMLMPRLLELVKASLPQEESYRKAIAELNSANVSLQQKNHELLAQLDKYNKEIDMTFVDHENRLKLLEGKIPENTPATESEPLPPT